MLKKILNFCKISIVSAPMFFVLNLILLFIIALARIGMSYSFKMATDTILYYKSIEETNFKLIMPILFFFLMICIGGNTINFEDMMINAYTKKSKKLFSKFFMYKSYNTKQDNFYKTSFYDNYEFVRNNMDNTTKITVTVFNKFTIAVFRLMLSVLAISCFDSLVLICVFILSLILVFINKYVVKKRMNLNKEYVNEERTANYYRELLSSRKYAKEIRIFSLQNKFLNKWDDSYKNYTVSKYKFEVKATILTNITNFIEAFMTYGLTVYFLYLVYDGTIDVGEFVFLNSIMWSLTYNIKSIVDILSKDLMDNYQYVEKYENFTGKISLDALKNISSDYNLKTDDIKGNFESLTFENVSYKYPNGNRDAVEKLNFSLNKGEVVSVLGYNGSGKSTFSKLMCGLLEDYEGIIKLNGKDIRSYDKESLYRYFGIGFQDFTKYSISLKENVQVGMIEKINDENSFNSAIEKGNLKEVINKLPSGINTILGKEYDGSGQDLSLGQWQRVILSRAYMGSPEVLILDEPTASIDPIEEMRMLNQFKDIVKNKTALLISHRIGFARMSSRICIMDNGKIVESGTHEELLKLKGKYYELFNSQQEIYKEGEVCV